MEVKKRLEVKPGVSDRLTVYRRPEARALLRKLLVEGSIKLDAASVSSLGVSAETFHELLGDMESRGLIVKSGSESVAKDPATGKTLFMIKLLCPYCKSSSVVKEEMLEHRECGFIGKLSEFQVRGGRLYCPRCGRPATVANVRRIGIWFRCKRCGQTFHKPEVAVYEPERGETIPIEELEISERTSYELNPDLKEEVGAIVGLYEKIEESLGKLGIRVEPLGTVKGVSGVVHEFDILVHTHPAKVGIDVLVCASQDKLMQSLLKLITKYFDLSGMDLRPVLMVAPRVPFAMRGMVSTNSLRGLTLIEGDTVSDLWREADRLGSLLAELISSTT